MHLDVLVSDLSLILIVAGIFTLIMKKLNQPLVLGYIIAGFLISPNFKYLPSVITTESITSWAEMGIIFLMFALGLEFSFMKIANVGGSAFVTAVTVMSAMIFIGYGTGQILGWGKMDCIFLGGMLSMSSTMIILKAYEEYKLKKEKFAQVVLGTLVIEDIAGIFMMIILSTISVSKNISGVNMASEIFILLLMLVVWLVAGIYLIPTLLKKVDRFLNNELLIILSLAICLGMVLIANFIGFSSALGAFVGGSILAGTVKAEKIDHLIGPIKDLFGAIFFVSVGMLIDPQLLVKYIGPIIIITLITIVGQMVFATIGLLLSGQCLRTAIRGGFSMVQIGEFSFIVASLGMSLGVISDFLYPIVVCVSVITSFTTPVFIKNAEKVYLLLERILPSKVINFLKKNTSDRQMEDDKDSDWKEYLLKVSVRTIICSTAMFTIGFLGQKHMLPFIENILPDAIGRYIGAAILIMAMMPFVPLMYGANKVVYTKLWLKHRANRLPLLTLKFIRIVIGACFIANTCNKILGLPFILVMLLGMALSYFMVKSDYLHGKAKSIEMGFIANFYEKNLAKKKKELSKYKQGPWMDESLKVVRIQIGKLDEENLTVKDIGRNPHVHVGIIKVMRGEKNYNVPKGSFELYEEDILDMMGTKEEIEASLMILEKLEYIDTLDYPLESLKNYIYGQTFKNIPPEKQIICIPLIVKDSTFFAKKSIKNSKIREKYRGSVIGIERDNLLITHPSIMTVIQPGDLLWIIGNNSMAGKMLKDNLLDEK